MTIQDSTFNLGGHTELEMWQFIIDYMTGLDPRITCNTTVAEQFADSSATATFDFNIDNHYIIRMYRDAVNSSGAAGLRAIIVVNGIIYGTQQYPYSWRYEYGYNEVKPADYYHIRLKGVTDTNYILFWLGLNWYEDATVLASAFPPTFSSAYLKGTSTQYASAYTEDQSSQHSDYILRGSFYNCADGASNYTISNTLLNFNAGVGNLSYTQHCPILNNGQMIDDFTDFISCSTISIGTSIALDTGNTYLAIGDHTLVPLTT